MVQKTSNSSIAATMLCATFILSACGGGGGSSSSSGSDGSGGSGGDATSLKAGLYETDVTNVSGNNPQTAVTYLSPTGKFVTAFGAGLSFGMLKFDDSNITGTSSDYADPDSEGFFENSDEFDGTLRGTINSQESATFTTANAAGRDVTIVKLQRENTASDFGTSLSRASGDYEQGVSEVVLMVEADGTLFAQYPNGCALAGTLVPAPSANVFDISYTMSSCTDVKRNGDYSGLGFFVPTRGGGQEIVFAAENGTVAMQFEGTR